MKFTEKILMHVWLEKFEVRKMMVKKILNYILVTFYAIVNDIKISNKNLISFKAVKRCGVKCRFFGEVYITKNVEIGRFTSINGPGTRISANINKIKIGSFCSIASNVVMQEYYHRYNRLTTYYIYQNLFNELNHNDIFSKGSIEIEEDVWIGSNSVILSGVSIGRGSIVGAGSVVTKSIPKYSIVAGNPAKVIKNRFQQETIDILEQLKWWEWDINKLKFNKYLFNLSEEELLIKFKGQNNET